MMEKTTDIQTSNDFSQMSGIIDIRQILSRGERVTLECKKALRSVPNYLWDTYSAFANTSLILNAWNEKHWIKPELVEQPELMQVKLTLYLGNDPVNLELKLTDRQRLILRLFSDDKTLTRERLCDKTGMSDSTAKREISYLKKMGMLERTGSDKTGSWIIKGVTK